MKRRIVKTVCLFVVLVLLLSVGKLVSNVSPILAVILVILLVLALFMYGIILMVEHRNRW